MASNPAVFQLNDIKIGIINTDVIKDMCINMCIKNPVTEPGQPAPQHKSKIDHVLHSILQQKSFYPLYPAGLLTPVDWDQFKALMFD